jgi:thioredoxin-related protein
MKKRGKSCLFLLLAMHLLMTTGSIAQVNTIPVEKLDSCMQTTAKPVLMLLTTDWCKYCQLQKAQLSRNKDLEAKKEDFYFIEFDAEAKDSVTFHGHTYNYKATGVSTGIHELVIALSGEKAVSFPAWILLSKDYQVVFRYNGVLSAPQLKELLKALSKI